MGWRNKRIYCQVKEPDSSKAKSCLMTNVRGAESSSDYKITTRYNPNDKIGLINIRRWKSERYSAKITNPIKHRKVYLSTFLRY